MLARPGFHTSEFLTVLVNFIGQVVLAMNGTVSDGTAAKYTVAGAVAYIISRGLAKYEPRGTGGTPAP